MLFQFHASLSPHDGPGPQHWVGNKVQWKKIIQNPRDSKISKSSIQLWIEAPPPGIFQLSILLEQVTEASKQATQELQNNQFSTFYPFSLIMLQLQIQQFLPMYMLTYKEIQIAAMAFDTLREIMP